MLGKGSFGKAYLVKNTEADLLCVVKQMETSMMDPKERNEAVKEAMLLKKMDHPNIVRFHEVFMTRKGRLCIVMDYADGGDVHMTIKQQDGALLTEVRIVEWFVQTCFALKHVHDRKVLHRDLKTQNIFLMSSGQIKLGDFGIARVLDATKDYAKTMVGTPYYLSPEIIADKPYNFKSDVWSCGIVLYETTTLKHPFDADSLVILAGKILKESFPDPDAMYTPDLVGLIRSMLKKDARERPSIDDILRIGFLQSSMHEMNAKHELGIDLTPFAPAAPAEAVADDEPAAAAASEPPPAQDEGDDYEDEFEDDSGSEADEEKESDLHQEVARLKLGGGDPVRDPSQAPQGEMSPDASGSLSKIGAKAESLRTYLSGQMPEADFERAYSIVRASEGVDAAELKRQVAEIIGEEKAPDLFTLFQLLCFLEDVATQGPAQSPISRSSTA